MLRSLLAIILILVSVTITHTQQTLRNVLSGANCEIACFLNIEPGVTTEADLETILNGLNIQYEISPIGLEGKTFDYAFGANNNWAHIGSHGSIGILVGDGIVFQMIVPLVDTPINTIVDLYGPPDGIVGDAAHQLVVYASQGIAFSVSRTDSTVVTSAWLTTPNGIAYAFIDNPNYPDVQPCTQPANLCAIETAVPQIESVFQIVSSGDRSVIALTYVSSTRPYLVELYDNLTGELIRTIDLDPYFPRRIALNPTGSLLAFADSSGNLGVFDLDNGSENILQSGSINIDVIAWNPVKDELAYALGSGVIIVDVSTGSIIHTISSSDSRVVALAWSADGEQMAISYYAENPFDPGDIQSNIKIWDVQTSEIDLTTPYLTIENVGGGAVSWNPDGTQLAINEQGKVIIYDTLNNAIIVNLEIDEDAIYVATWDQSGAYLATGGRVIRIWDTATWQVARTIETAMSVSSIEWSLDGKHLFHNGSSSGFYRDDIPGSQLPLTPTPP